jgi:hypothetical protein
MSISALSTGDLSYWEQLAAAALNKTGNSGEKISSDFVLADSSAAEPAEEAAAGAVVADKSVSLEELEAALQRAADLARLQLGLNQEEDQPGTEELTAAPASGASGGAAASGGQQVFDSLDANRDGVVSHEELAAFLKTSQEQGEQADSGRAVTKLQAAISAYNAQALIGGGGILDLAA